MIKEDRVLKLIMERGEPYTDMKKLLRKRILIVLILTILICILLVGAINAKIYVSQTLLPNIIISAQYNQVENSIIEDFENAHNMAYANIKSYTTPTEYTRVSQAFIHTGYKVPQGIGISSTLVLSSVLSEYDNAEYEVIYIFDASNSQLSNREDGEYTPAKIIYRPLNEQAISFESEFNTVEN